MEKPTISICIPTFNRADLLDITLQSVANQTVKPYEVIVVDNASDDDTAKIVAQYKKNGFRYVRNRTNIGMIGNWNKAINLGKGSHICLLHSDDLIAPTWYEHWQNAILKNKADIYTCAIIVVDNNLKPIFVGRIYDQNMLVKQPDVTRFFLKNSSPVIPPTGATIYKKEVFRNVGLFDPQYGVIADAPFSLKTFRDFNYYYLNNILFVHRVHDLRSFDMKVVKKTADVHLKNMEKFFQILKDFSQKYPPKERQFFIASHMAMTLGTINLYIFKLQFRKVTETYRLIKKYFPNYLRTIIDWQILLEKQILFVRRILFGRLLWGNDKKETAWLYKRSR